jgi:hypothetical protein
MAPVFMLVHPHMNNIKILSVVAAALASLATVTSVSAGTINVTSGPDFDPAASFSDSTIQVQVLGGNLGRASGNVRVIPPVGGNTASISISGTYSVAANELASSAYSFTIDSGVATTIQYKVTGSAVILGTNQTFEGGGDILPGLHQYKGSIKSGRVPFSTSGTFTGTLTFDFTAAGGASSAAPSAADANSLNCSIAQFDFMVGATEDQPLPDAQTLNLSTRVKVETGDNVLIGGFIVSGTQDKKVILRAIAPSLGIDGALQDTTLELRDGSGALIVANDDWQDTQKTEIEDSGVPPTDLRESAIVRTLPANNALYTAIVRGKANTTGIALVELYDLDQAVDSKLANISTRALVQTGNDVIIGGFIVGPDTAGAAPIIIRGIGPSLTAAGVPNALQNPTLELHDADGALLDSNDNWQDAPNHDQVSSNGLAPTDPAESALWEIPGPGKYTAIVRGVDNSEGVALVEIYHL